MFLTFGFKFFVALMLISAVIAFVGDRLGHIIGKKRLTFFNLRPKQTAIIFTVITGILIAFFTLGFILISSHSARLALFGLEKLQSEITIRSTELKAVENELAQAKNQLAELENNQATSKKEIDNLQNLKTRLENQIAVIKKGKLVFNAGEVITSCVVQYPNVTGTAAQIDGLLADANSKLSKLGYADDQKVIIDPEDLNKTKNYIENHPGQIVLQLISINNTVLGEKMYGKFKLTENKIIYSKGKVLGMDYFQRGTPTITTEDRLRRLLAKVSAQAKADGITTMDNGNVGNIPYSQIMDVAKKTILSQNGIEVRVITLQETRVSGPLSVELKVYYR